MRFKKIACLFSLMILFLPLLHSAFAISDTIVSFNGSGVAIDLNYPEEAQPNETIRYNVTLTATAELSSINIDLLIYAPVNSTMQLIKSQPISWGTLHENQTLPTVEVFPILLPEQADGRVLCNIKIQTEIDSALHYSAYSFFTTFVSDPTLSEMRVLYDEMVANYTILQEEYETLWGDYNATLANYTALVNEFSETSSQYEEQISAYQNELEKYNDYDTIKNSYTAKIKEFNDLQTNYEDLNTTLNELQANYTQLVTDYEDLKDNYTILENDSKDLKKSLDSSKADLGATTFVMIIFLIAVVILISFILYLKRKGEEPYIVIRKETVSMKSDKDKGTDSNISSNASLTNF